MKNTIALIFLVLAFSQLLAQESEIRTKHFNLKKTIALEGYDPVSYFDSKPLEGKSEHKFSFKGMSNYI